MTVDGGIVGRLGNRLRAGEAVRSAWMVWSDPALAEAAVRAGFDTAVLDMQHGAFTVETASAAIASMALAGAPAIVRVPVGDFATASRMFDAGAAAVIAPMINTAAEARAFAAFSKFVPAGERSWGPSRALALTGLTPDRYLAEANGLQLAIAMIETRAALSALDEILAVPGLDGVLIGPGDLSISLSGGRLDPTHPELDRALDHVVARTRAAGKLPFMFCMSGTEAKAMLARGFALVTVAIDAVMFARGAEAELAATR